MSRKREHVSTKLTSAQRRILEAAARHTHGRVAGGDPRTRALLSNRGFIEHDGYGHGPLFKITDAGRRAVTNGKPAKKVSPAFASTTAGESIFGAQHMKSKNKTPIKTPIQRKLEAARAVAERIARGERKFSLRDVRDLFYGFYILDMKSKHHA